MANPTVVDLGVAKTISSTTFVELCSKTVTFQNVNPLPAATSQTVTVKFVQGGMDRLVYRTKNGTKTSAPYKVEPQADGSIKISFAQVWMNAFGSGKVALEVALLPNTAPVVINPPGGCLCHFEISPTV